MTTDQWKRDNVERARLAYLANNGLPRRMQRAQALVEAREPAPTIPEPDEVPDADDASLRRGMLT